MREQGTEIHTVSTRSLGYQLFAWIDVSRMYNGHRCPLMDGLGSPSYGWVYGIPCEILLRVGLTRALKPPRVV